MADFTEVVDGPASFFRRIRKGVTDSVSRPVPGLVRVIKTTDVARNGLPSDRNRSDSDGKSVGSSSNPSSNSSSSPSFSSTPPPKYYRLEQFDNILGGENIDLNQLRKLSWNGVPPQYRTMVWQLLLGYLPTNKRYYHASHILMIRFAAIPGL